MTQKAEEEKKIFPYSPRQRCFNDIVNDLHKEIPARFIKQRKQGGKMIDYVPWYRCVKLMDYYAPGWSYEIRRMENFSDGFFLVVRVTIPASDGEFYREATGTEKIDKEGYGDTSSNAESMALRRCFAKFGLAIDLYEKDDASPPRSQGNQQSAAPRSQNAAPANNGLATEKQINWLTKLAKDAKKSEIEICEEFSNNRVDTFDRLTIAEISKAIEAYK